MVACALPLAENQRFLPVACTAVPFKMLKTAFFLEVADANEINSHLLCAELTYRKMFIRISKHMKHIKN